MSKTIFDYVDIIDDKDDISAKLNEAGTNRIHEGLKTITDVLNFISGFTTAHQIITTFNISGSGPQVKAEEFLAYKVLMIACFTRISVLIDIDTCSHWNKSWTCAWGLSPNVCGDVPCQSKGIRTGEI
jgi:hypothetical protein